MAGRPPRRVVVVDPDEGVLRLCQRVLERAGFEVAVFDQAYDALDYLEQRMADVLIADSDTPAMSGFALMEQARLLQPNLAVVIMSRYDTIENAVMALNQGANGLLLKPFERMALVESVWRAVAHRQRQEETARMAALRPLFDVAEALISERRLKPLQALVVEKVQEVLPSSAVGLYLWTRDSDEGCVLASIGKVLPANAPLWKNVPPHRHPVRLDIQSSEGEERALLEAYGWSSVLLAVVPREERRYALLVAREQMPFFHDEVDATALGILARLAATALESARLYEDLHHSLEELRRSQQALAQAEKMAAVGRLTGSLAHEVNNPIQAVRNSLYLATHPEIEEDRRQQYLHLATEEIERLSALVHRMLNFYRPGKVERQAVSLAGLAKRVVGLLAAQLEKHHIEVTLDVPATLPPVYGVEDQLQQVVLNLVLNAMEAMPEGGRLFVLGWAMGEKVVLAVEDTGPGIASEVRDRLFEPLVSTKESGTGLGLAVSYNIIADHGGQLELSEPTRGSGAAFRIVLPVWDEKASPETEGGRDGQSG
ncbi:MAG TPA: response regulator [Chloroflexi bacterium]|nr:response regulator [Chloroflexota bacterium]